MSSDEVHDSQRRRSEDRDRYLNARLDQLEKAHQDLTTTVTHLEQSVQTVKMEQMHLKELFEARLRIIEKNQEIQIAASTQISRDIIAMGDDPQRTPSGRLMLLSIASLDKKLVEQNGTLEQHAVNHLNLLTWQNRVDGVLYTMRWVGAGGLIALGISILRLIKVIP